MADPYQVRLSSQATRALNLRLPPGVAVACWTFITEVVASNPYRLGKPLTRELTGLYSARRGVYRVIYRIDEDEHVLSIIRIDHRRSVYH